MKTFTQLLEARQLDIQDDVINNISKADLEKYLTVASKFISSESIEIIQYMIDNPDYIEKLASKESTNCFADFYSGKAPKDASLKRVYANLNKVAKANRLLEIPNLQTKEQFNSIINNKVAPDEILLDLKTEKGRNDVVARYDKLLHKICNQWKNKTNLSEDELWAAALHGLTNAMNGYGKKQVSNDDEDTAVKSTTFGQYAAYAIRFAILDDVKNRSQVVRVPISVQNKERKERGVNTRNNSISGDNKLGDDEKSKRLFDMVGGVDDTESSMDNKDLDMLWKNVFKKLEQHFDKNVMFAWYSFRGLNGYKQMKNKDIAKKIDCNPSLVTYYNNIVNDYIRKTPDIMSLMKEIYDLMRECLHDREHDSDLIEDGLTIVNTNTDSVDD